MYILADNDDRPLYRLIDICRPPSRSSLRGNMPTVTSLSRCYIQHITGGGLPRGPKRRGRVRQSQQPNLAAVYEQRLGGKQRRGPRDLPRLQRLSRPQKPLSPLWGARAKPPPLAPSPPLRLEAGRNTRNAFSGRPAGSTKRKLLFF